MNRRKFNKTAGLTSLSLLTGLATACKNNTENSVIDAAQSTNKVKEPFFKPSLAQWSLNRSFREKKVNPLNFASMSRALGFEAIEYVSQLYLPTLESSTSTLVGMQALAKSLLEKSNEQGIENLLIMIDREGDLAIKDKGKRMEGIENHKKWIDAAKHIGCHSIRINLFGKGSAEEQLENSLDSLRLLGAYAKDQDINVLVENHGGFSSDPNWLVKVMKQVNMDNVGTLPDFGNFCIEREGGERWGTPCINEYPDIYQAVEMMMPFAKAVSAKSYNFNDKGDETKIDYYKMMKVVKDAGYTGYIGIEFEGEAPENEGIIATRELMDKAGRI